MSTVTAIRFEPKYRRNGLAVLDTDTLPLPSDFVVRETSVVRLEAGHIAGNHTHPRREAYLCLDKQVELYWIDDTGRIHIEPMMNDDQSPRLFVVPSNVPHAIVNASDKDATLLGYADGVLEHVETIEVARQPSKSSDSSESQTAQAVALLAKLKPGFLPFALFHEITRLVTTPIIEIVPLRQIPGNKIEILLLKRETYDPIWPGHLHIPGTVVRASDTPGSFDDALERILSKELMNLRTSKPVFVKNILHHSGRGLEASQIYWVEVEDDSSVGTFYDAENLPETIVQSQLDFIPDAVAHFKKTKS